MRNVSCPWSMWVEKYKNEVFLLTCKLESFDPTQGTAFNIGGCRVA